MITNLLMQAIKSLADSLAAIQSLVCDLELIQFTAASLSSDYDTFVNIFSLITCRVIFDDLCSKLPLYESRI